MEIKEIKNRDTALIKDLIAIWKASVRASHSFLSDKDIKNISCYVLIALKEIDVLLIGEDNGKKTGFAGIAKGKLEMLFIEPSCFGKGIGRALVETAVKKYHITEVDVNEQNPEARKFYEHMGFVVYDRDELDGQGNPFPILHMRLK